MAIVRRAAMAWLNEPNVVEDVVTGAGAAAGKCFMK